MEQLQVVAEQLKEYIKPELLILIPVLYVLGYALKKSKVADEWIPWILVGTGIAMATLYVCGTDAFTLLSIFTAITQGTLCAGMSVCVNQLIKQQRKRALNNDGD